ncbi:uncharacterized protein PGTG_12519 [Puccinia graminis f. sp. tritici CRL 75-36-700-3]|uniref:Glycosyl transferase CAP10 domain-containing protein n=1 Tax=Puccinia graminis f. sp. tritici (strain CRL 75-36-700-3 / race SCCL) TaxID=418459 RepID=E3KUX2_PUCGT|nr:uncharacterized protein PGTG_12519 [Puccinia graminis f. sp. tritici CRL 75-36-700-3]EFP88072.2 hypothetical protein PGTG_12519 [Puccinia graminis f. sp. tritici CRL 75-36-700-3]
MAGIRRLLLFTTLLLSLSILLIFYSSSTTNTNNSLPTSASSLAIQDRLKGYLPNKETLKTYVPKPFKWSNWATSDAVELEDSLITTTTTNQQQQNSNKHNNQSTSQTNQSTLPTNYHPNGLYYLSQPPPLERHPILDLIDKAEQEWANKVAKSSRSLEEAVAEYRRRYHQPPPFGFEKWWEYAQKEGVILTDEYDQIGADIKPFLAIEPSDLLHRAWVMANERPETFTLTINSTAPVLISGKEGHLARAKDLAKLINLFVHLLPQNSGSINHLLNLTFTKHDQPAVQMTWPRKQKMVEMAEAGEYFSPSDYIRPSNPKLSNWANACPPHSALYRNESNLPPLEDESLPPGMRNKNNGGTKSFIYDHSKAMEICGHPESMKLHGFTSAAGTDNVELVPLFTFAKTTTQSDILVTPLEQYSDTYIGDDPEWSKKKITKLLWRGSTTGAEFRSDVDWRASQRARLHLMAHHSNGSTHILSPDDSLTRIVSKDIESLNHKLLDVSFSGGPVQCDPVTCEYMHTHLKFAGTMGLDESYQYKYLMDVDGNGWSGRFHRLMSTKSLVLKSTIFPEWYSDRIQPWVHYVPIKVDYSDLYDVMVFFQGEEEEEEEEELSNDPKSRPTKRSSERKRKRSRRDGDGGRERYNNQHQKRKTKKNNGHDQLAEKIASQGKRWAAEHWRRTDMAAYMFRLVLEWRRVMLRGTGEPLDYFG